MEDLAILIMIGSSHDFKHFQCRNTLELSTGESTPSGPRSGTPLEILSSELFALQASFFGPVT